MFIPATTTESVAAVSTATHVVQFNPVSQLPIRLQGNLSFSTLKAQLVMLLNGHKLLGHLTYKNLISVAKFCTYNLTSIKFFLYSVLVKDLKIRYSWYKAGINMDSMSGPKGIMSHLLPT